MRNGSFRGWLARLAGVWLALIIMGMLPTITFASGGDGEGDVKQETEWCQTCHGNPNIVGILMNGEEASVFVEFDEYWQSVHGQEEIDCHACHEGKESYPHHGGSMEGCLFCHMEGGQQIVEFTEVEIQLFYEDGRAMTVHLSRGCLSCHEEQTQAFKDSVHLQVLSTGNADAPVCVDCHGGHEVSVPFENRAEIAEACGECHEQMYEDYRASVHGEGLANGASEDVPICTDCHGVHDARGPEDSTFRNDSVVLCGGCHADEERMGKYGISTQVFETYLDDFHGVSVNLFRLEEDERPSTKAVCYDCHGIHDIRRPEDPLSQVYPSNLVGTCQKCHEDANIAFPAAWLSHYVPTYDDNPILYLVDQVYPVAIASLFSFIVAYNGLDLRRRMVAKKVANRKKKKE